MSDPNEFNLTGNQISRSGKIWAGALLILLTSAAIFFLFAFWPDKIPSITDTGDSKYVFKLFQIRLITGCDCPDSINKIGTSGAILKEKQAVNNLAPDNTMTDTVHKTPPDKNPENKMAIQSYDSILSKYKNCCCLKKIDTIDLNTIFLILVAITGFIGNMIHISTSFTTFVGNDNFKKTWILWYVVKPFTASALALIIYFIIRAGFLSYGSDAKNVSLYGILSLSALAGLFTDTATLKLKEIFETIFRPKDERDDKLTAFSIDNIIPETLKKGVNNLSLKGKGLDSKKLVLKIDTQEITPATVAADSIDFTYSVADTVASQSKLQLSVFDESKKEVFRKQLIVQ